MRHGIYLKRVAGEGPPYTDNEQLAPYRWTNVWRVLDRVSQRVVRLDEPGLSPGDKFIRVMMLKAFNRPETYDALCHHVGAPTEEWFPTEEYAAVLKDMEDRKMKIWSPAYMILGVDEGGRDQGRSKWESWIEFLARIHREEWWRAVQTSTCVDEIVAKFFAVKYLGQFYAWQFTTDLGYVGVHMHDDWQFATTGPGSIRGVRHVYGDEAKTKVAIRNKLLHVTKNQDELQMQFGMEPLRLAGRKLQPIDIQNCFCEFDKWVRVQAGEKRQKYRPTAGGLLETKLPAHWSTT